MIERKMYFPINHTIFSPRKGFIEKASVNKDLIHRISLIFIYLLKEYLSINIYLIRTLSVFPFSFPCSNIINQWVHLCMESILIRRKMKVSYILLLPINLPNFAHNAFRILMSHNILLPAYFKSYI